MTSELDSITWRLLLCCAVAASASGWMLYYVAYEAPAIERDNVMMWVPPISGIIMSIAIVIISELYKRKKISII